MTCATSPDKQKIKSALSCARQQIKRRGESQQINVDIFFFLFPAVQCVCEMAQNGLLENAD